MGKEFKVDRKAYKKFEKDFKKLGSKIIQVGAVGQHDKAEMSNAELLIIHEFGASVKNGFGKGIKFEIPARMPIALTIQKPGNRKILAQNLTELIKIHYDEKQGLAINKITGGVGETLKAMVKTNIKDRLSPANTPATLKLKRGTLPLVDTGQLFDSIEFGVRT